MSFDSEPKRALSLNNAYDTLSEEQINKVIECIMSRI